MEIIQKASSLVIKLLGTPQTKGKAYRLFTFCIFCDVPEGVLLYNLLTCELVLLTKEEYLECTESSELRKRWFVVPVETNDLNTADKIRTLMQVTCKKPQGITKYTIFPTTDCNARCFYCYELGRSRIHMTDDVAKRTAKFIEQNSKGKPVKLTWFGGEPLYNKKAINIICHYLHEKGIDYKSKIVSNAYLFDEYTIKQAISLWNLTNTQITIDGTEDIYNTCKSYIYDNVNPYQVVLHNIELLLTAGIKVIIRMNLDKHNEKDLFILAREIYERFPNQSGLHVYVKTLFEYAGNKVKIRERTDRMHLIHKQQELTELLLSYGLGIQETLRTNPPPACCMVDDRHSVTILPEGDIGLCEHYSEDHFIGHIDKTEFDEQMIVHMREYQERSNDCISCFYYPQCLQLKHCLERASCSEEYRTSLYLQTVKAMKHTFSQHQNK